MRRRGRKKVKGKILVVDDNEFNIYSLQIMLESKGIESDFANNGLTSIQMVEEMHKSNKGYEYKLVLMDCNMPLMDGFEAVGILKQKMSESKLNYIPVVATTASVLKEDQQRCKEAGFDNFLGKPITSEALDNILQQYAY